MKVFLSIIFWVCVISVLANNLWGLGVNTSPQNIIGSIIVGLIIWLMVYYPLIFFIVYRYRYPSEVDYQLTPIEDTKLFKHKKVQEYHTDLTNLSYVCYGVTNIPVGKSATQVGIYFNSKNNSYVYMYPPMNGFVPVGFYKEISPNRYMILGATYYQAPFSSHISEIIDYYSVKGKPELSYVVDIFDKKMIEIGYMGKEKTVEEYIQQQKICQKQLAKLLIDKQYLKPHIDENGCQKLTLKGIFELFKTQAFLFNIPTKMRAEKKFKEF